MWGGARAGNLAAMVALVCGAAALIPASTALGSSRGAPARGQIAVATTKHPSELRERVPIKRRAGHGKVVMSLGPNRLPDLRRGDRLELYGEVQVTMDCYRPSPRCAGRPYHFNPVIEGRLEISSSQRPGRRAATIGRRRLSCLQHLPSRQHHCPIVFAGAAAKVDRRLPCPPRRCFVNLVIEAHSRAADGGEVVVIGSNRPDGDIVQGKGELSALRVRPPSVRPDLLATERPRRPTLPLDAQRRTILSRKLTGLRRGDKLAVSAELRSGVRHLGYNALVGAQLILARSPAATNPSSLVRRVAARDGAISRVNGTNCTPVKSPCGTRKAGVTSLRRDPGGRSGHPVALFVNLVIRTKQKRLPDQADDRLRIRDGRLAVRLYRAESP